MAFAQSGSCADPLTMMQITRKQESHQEFTNYLEPHSLLRRPPSSSSHVEMILPSSKTITIFDNPTQHCDDDDDDDDGKKKKKKKKKICDDEYCITCSCCTPSSKPIASAEEEEVHWWKQVLDPKRKSVQHWNKLFVLSCFFALFVDPLFFFTIGINPVCCKISFVKSVTFSM
jgi:hypothetical protein